MWPWTSLWQLQKMFGKKAQKLPWIEKSWKKKAGEKIRFFLPKKKSSLHLLVVKDDIGITKLADFIADKVKNGGKPVRVIFKSEFNKKKMHRNDWTKRSLLVPVFSTYKVISNLRIFKFWVQRFEKKLKDNFYVYM